MHVNKHVFKMVKALHLHILSSVDESLEQRDNEPCYVDFVGVDIGSIEIVRRKKSGLSRVRW